ncbi:MAG: class I SAM-dependent methyltransferase [Chloroflexi bacterium]|nr:MAG: class I SAM-dependent methyltransferase [Chloroflexota bacterium]
MNCQCQGIEELFNQKQVDKELSRYRTKGPDKTTRILVQAIKEQSVKGSTLLDVGGGVGAVQHELMAAGIEKVIGVDASGAYLNAAMQEAQRRGKARQVIYYHGNFVDLAEEISSADIVTLNRVICCYNDMDALVGSSAKRAKRLYGLVFPRDTWWIKLGVAVGNILYRIRNSSFRGFVHTTEAVEAVVRHSGFERKFYHRTLLWQIAVYSR